MFHIPYRLTLLMRSPESYHDSGKPDSWEQHHILLSRKSDPLWSCLYFIVDPNNAPRFFRTYPNSLIGLNISTRSWLISVKNFVNYLKNSLIWWNDSITHKFTTLSWPHAPPMPLSCPSHAPLTLIRYG
eukprot:sb/3475297/